MRQKLIFFLALLGTILAFEAKALNENESGIAASAAKEYNIHGKITDASGAPLPYATVAIEGTSKGVISGADGTYLITGLRPGTYTVKASYLGYRDFEKEVQVQNSSTLDIILEENARALKDVVVYGNLTRGQARALTLQKNALHIVNVIDYEQFSKFPDRNAAEALQRIPGISISKDQGEGEFVMVRGLAPQYNSVQLNGQRIPSPDKDDERGTGMGLLLADMMQSIVVSKTSTADMDGDAIGGTVNFNLKEAPDKTYLGVNLQGGYNFQHSDFNHWGKDIEHASVMYGQRFFDNKLGLLLSGSIDNNNIGSMLNQYTYVGDTEEIQDKRWNDYDVKRTRYGFIVSPDYRFNERNKIRLLYTYNQYNDDEIRRRADFLMTDPSESTLRREPRNRIEKVNTSMIQLSGEHYIDRLKIDYTLANIHSDMDEPDQTSYRFEKKKVDLSGLSNQARRDLTGLSVFLPDNEYLSLSKATTNFEKMTDRDNSARLNLTLPFSLLQQESRIKVGAKWLKKNKKYTNLTYTGTIDKNSEAGHLKDGSFGFEAIKSRKEDGRVPVSEYVLDAPVNSASYKASEEVISAYAMAELKWLGNLVTVLGVRYEHTADDYFHYESERDGKSSYQNFLPSVNVVYNIDDKSNLKLAYSEGISRPSYSKMVPYYNQDDQSLTISKGNPDLKATTAHSLDLLFERYTNNLGMLTAGIFYTKINDEITSTKEYQILNGDRYEITTPVNMGSSRIWGAEVALNYRFKQLNVPFLKDLGIYANYTFTRSQSSYNGRKLAMSSSPEHVANLSLFYDNEKGGWSFALTNVYRSHMLFAIGENEMNDQYYGQEYNLDFTISKRLWKNITLSLQLNNLTDQETREYLGNPGKSFSRLQQKEGYGRRIQLGLMWKL